MLALLNKFKQCRSTFICEEVRTGQKIEAGVQFLTTDKGNFVRAFVNTILCCSQAGDPESVAIELSCLLLRSFIPGGIHRHRDSSLPLERDFVTGKSDFRHRFGLRAAT